MVDYYSMTIDSLKKYKVSYVHCEMSGFQASL